MHKLKTAFCEIATRVQRPTSPPTGDSIETQRSDNKKSLAGRLLWPPRLVNTRILGEVQDVSGRQYARDLGRSIHLGIHTYYMFGDTFCFDNSGEFKGVTNNSVSLVPDTSIPTKSQYCGSEVKVPEFIPFSDEERKFCESPDNQKSNRRIVNWAFGGVIEIPGSGGKEGWLFYDQVETQGGIAVKQNGIGIGKVKFNDSNGEVTCARIGKFPFFPGNGPLWGNISNIPVDDGWTYLLSGIGSDYGLDNYMARISTSSDFSNEANYQFLLKNGVWASSYSAPYGPFGELEHSVLAGQGQGAIVYLPEFAPPATPYVWIGCEKFPTSQLCVGVAANPVGPWDVAKLGEMPKITENAKTRYCIYPHIWGSDLTKGEILISWSDDGTMGGKVATAIFTFAIEVL